MANEANTEVIIVDQESKKEEDEDFKFPKNVKMFIHTGNIATWNSLKTRKTQMPANEVIYFVLMTCPCILLDQLYNIRS